MIEKNTCYFCSNYPPVEHCDHILSDLNQYQNYHFFLLIENWRSQKQEPKSMLNFL